MKYKKYAVLGSNSFAGSTFIAGALARNCNVIGFSRSEENNHIFLPYVLMKKSGVFEFVKADLNTDVELIFKYLNDLKPEVIVDFAGQGMVAESWLNPDQWYTTNIVSKVKLHELLRESSWLKRYIRISTPEVYGSHIDLIDENCPYNPSTPYAVSHACIDMSLSVFHRQYNFPVIFTRFANFYGPGQQLYRIIPRTILYGLLGKKLQLHGGGISKRAFIYGTDVANAIFQAAELGVTGEVYHFSSNEFLSIKSVVELICREINVDAETFVQNATERPGKDQAYLMRSDKARSQLKWSELVGFEEGIKLTLNWIRSSIQEIKNMPMDYIHKK